MAISGCDVSKWQADGVPNTAFVMMKATQGFTEVDNKYPSRLSACRAAKKLIGSYAYANGNDPIAEADFYVQNNHRVAGEIQALDFESSPGVLTVKDPVGWALTWLQRVEALTHNKPLIYMSGNTASRFSWSRVVKNNNGLWLASWGVGSPSAGQWPFVIMWQNSDNGHIAPFGASNVDTDIFYGNADTWNKYGSGVMNAPVDPTSPPYDTIKATNTPGLICRRSDGAVFVIEGGKIHHVPTATDVRNYFAAGYTPISLTDRDIDARLKGL